MSTHFHKWLVSILSSKIGPRLSCTQQRKEKTILTYLVDINIKKCVGISRTHNLQEITFVVIIRESSHAYTSMMKHTQSGWFHYFVIG